MSDLVVSINNNREQEIATHYASVVAEIDAKTKAEPLRTKFDIYTGCPSKDIADVVARRLNAAGIKTTVVEYGFFRTSHYLQVEIDLPESLAPEVVPAPESTEQEETEQEASTSDSDSSPEETN